MNSQEIKALFIQGERALHTECYGEAVAIFERLSQEVDASAANYFNIQRELVKAYKENQQIKEAVTLCKQIIASPIEAYQIWGFNFLANVTGEPLVNLISPQEKPQKESVKAKSPDYIRQKSLTEFKDYCQENLLPSLKKFEQQRKYAIATIIITGILVCLLFRMSLIFIVPGIAIEICLILIILWIIYCQGCLFVSNLGFKREIIGKIVDFIDDNNTLEYGNKLLIEDNRRTTLNFRESQLFQRGLIEPDFFRQEDCVYGNIGETDIFFSEIIAQKSKLWHRNNNRKTIFRGLFFVAKFPKNFKSRAFILPQNLKSHLPLIESWRGELVNLEDSEFHNYFRVYSYDQVEARYILSTSLMARLVKFRKRVKRHIHISFIDGHIFIAIRYYHDLFEPRLFKSMLSFAPLREYFEILQFMIAIVNELNLNQNIWH